MSRQNRDRVALVMSGRRSLLAPFSVTGHQLYRMICAVVWCKTGKTNLVSTLLYRRALGIPSQDLFAVRHFVDFFALAIASNDRYSPPFLHNTRVSDRSKPCRRHARQSDAHLCLTQQDTAPLLSTCFGHVVSSFPGVARRSSLHSISAPNLGSPKRPHDRKRPKKLL
jgi:hypothetical protein